MEAYFNLCNFFMVAEFQIVSNKHKHKKGKQSRWEKGKRKRRKEERGRKKRKSGMLPFPFPFPLPLPILWFSSPHFESFDKKKVGGGNTEHEHPWIMINLIKI